jgi:hypothetical protein
MLLFRLNNAQSRFNVVLASTTIPQPNLALDIGSVKVSKYHWTAGRYSLLTDGRSLFLVFSSEGRSVFLFWISVRLSVGISCYLDRPVR